MEIKTLELTGVALDYAVAVCEGISPIIDDGRIYSRYPQGKEWDYPITYQNWSQGGPIIEREKIDIYWDDTHKEWTANGWYYGDNALVAAMRCYVASKLGGVVDVPEDLIE